jgi:hypothetical protein
MVRSHTRLVTDVRSLLIGSCCTARRGSHHGTRRSRGMKEHVVRRGKGVNTGKELSASQLSPNAKNLELQDSVTDIQQKDTSINGRQILSPDTSSVDENTIDEVADTGFFLTDEEKVEARLKALNLIRTVNKNCGYGKGVVGLSQSWQPAPSANLRSFLLDSRQQQMRATQSH